MQRNIVAIHNVLKKKTTQLNFQPVQYLKKLAKIILNKNKKKLKKKEKKRRSQFWKKKTCKKKGEQKHKTNMWGKLQCVGETLQQSTVLFFKKL